MKIYLMVAALATGTFFACKQAGFTKEKNTSNMELSPVAMQDGMLSEQDEKTKTPGQQKPLVPPKDPVPVPADYSKQIIRNAKISFEVKDANSVNTAVSEAVRISGGYIASANEVQLAGERKHEMTIRVPREKFDELLNRISGYADTLLQKNISSEDVTAEYIDTKARITAKEKVKERYYDFLKQAKNIDEVLKVQSEIGQMQEEIEAASGRVNYIQHQATLSTIFLSFFEPLPVAVAPQEPAPGFWKEIWFAIAQGWEMIQLLVIGLARIWPLWVGGVLVWSMIRRRKILVRTTNNKM